MTQEEKSVVEQAADILHRRICGSVYCMGLCIKDAEALDEAKLLREPKQRGV